MLKIDTIRNHERMSTQDLLLTIEAAVREGETDFDFVAPRRQDFEISRHERGATCRLDVLAEHGNCRRRFDFG